MMNWFKKHAYELHLLTFAFMVLTSIGMYFTAVSGALGLTVILIGVFALANFLVLIVP
jgi:hypothetical protein